MSAKRAVLIFEGPWNLDQKDLNRSSVLPFFEGMAKQFSDVEIIYTRYYDLHSFRAAFDELACCQHKNAIAYIAGHGDGTRVSGANIIKILSRCNVESWKVNITGVLLGSCFSAGRPGKPLDVEINNMIQDSNIAWIAAYKCASYWFSGTMIDLAIICQMLASTNKKLTNRDSINKQLANAITPFSPTFELGDNSITGESGDSISLRNGLAFFSQPRGQGHKAREVTEDIWDEWKALQLLSE